MKKFLNNLKESFSKNETKATFWSMLITVICFIPIIIIVLTLLLQYSYITYQFWIIIYIAIISVILLFSFSSVLNKKILANYENIKFEKKEYKKIFIKELFGPFSICFLIVTTIIYLDQLSKNIANLHLIQGKVVNFIPHLINWRLAYNTGAAWSILSDHTNILAYVSLIASFVIMYFLKNFDIKKRPLYSLALAFILGGTIGNMIDRFFYSKGVIDFIDFAFMDFPTFNVADSFLVVGTCMLALYIIIDMVKEDKNHKKKKLIKKNTEVDGNIND